MNAFINKSIMRAKIITQKNEIRMYLANGTYVIMNARLLKEFFFNYDKVFKFNQSDGTWDFLSCSLDKISGKTLAYVTAQNKLVVECSSIFEIAFSANGDELFGFHTIDEYAVLHNKNRNTINKLCNTGRIIGAIKVNSRWYIPIGAPYPERISRAQKKDE